MQKSRFLRVTFSAYRAKGVTLESVPLLRISAGMLHCGNPGAPVATYNRNRKSWLYQDKLFAVLRCNCRVAVWAENSSRNVMPLAGPVYGFKMIDGHAYAGRKCVARLCMTTLSWLLPDSAEPWSDLVVVSAESSFDS